MRHRWKRSTTTEPRASKEISLSIAMTPVPLYRITSTSTVTCGPVVSYNDGIATPYTGLLHDHDYTDILERRFHDACDTIASQIQMIKDLHRPLTKEEKTAFILSLNALLDVHDMVRDHVSAEQERENGSL